MGEIDIAGVADEEDQKEKSAQEKKEGVREFEEKIKEGMVTEQPERVLDEQAGKYQCEKTGHECRERERSIFQRLSNPEEEAFHIGLFYHISSENGESGETVIN